MGLELILHAKSQVFWSRVKVGHPDECWEWQGALAHNGYGRFSPRVNGAMVRTMAHRFAFATNAGQNVPHGLVIDHLCRNRACCNPDHLEAVTHRVNVLRGVSQSAINAAKEFCVDGHEFDVENTYVHPKRGTRNCRACISRRNREYVERKRRG